MSMRMRRRKWIETGGTAQHAVGETEQWCLPTKFDALAFPTVMKKVIRHVLER